MWISAFFMTYPTPSPLGSTCMLFSFDQVDSTNRIAKEYAASGEVPSGSVVLARTQSAGRGQYGRSFSSPPGGLYFSLLVRPDLPVDRLPMITLATGLAVRILLTRQFGLAPLIKWPNDVYLEHQKVAGILCENVFSASQCSSESTVVIGVGVNVNSVSADFPPDLAPLVTTVREHIGRVTELAPLLDCLVATINEQILVLGTDPDLVLQQWQQADYLLAKPVCFTNGDTVIKGIGGGITPLGYYRLTDSQGCEHRLLGGQLRPDF